LVLRSQCICKPIHVSAVEAGLAGFVCRFGGVWSGLGIGAAAAAAAAHGTEAGALAALDLARKEQRCSAARGIRCTRRSRALHKALPR